MSGLEILGVPDFAIALADAVAKSYHLIERYKDANPRKLQLLNEIQATLALLSRLQDLVSDPAAIIAIERSGTASLYAWLSRCQTTHHDILAQFGGRSDLSRKQRLRLSVSTDVFTKFEGRVRNDRTQLVALLETLNLYVCTLN